MAALFVLFVVISQAVARTMESFEICKSLNCDNDTNTNVCGFKKEGAVVHLRLFDNECALLQYGCSVDDDDAYGLINLEYCKELLTRRLIVNRNTTKIPASYGPFNKERKTTFQMIRTEANANYSNETITNDTKQSNNTCKYADENEVCGIRLHGDGYKVRLFKNKCELTKSIQNTEVPFMQTDMFICEGSLRVSNGTGHNITTKSEDGVYVNNVNDLLNSEKIIVINSSMLKLTDDINRTIDDFFAATHVSGLPIKQIDGAETRKQFLKIASPFVLFQPWVVKPKIVREDYYYLPTLYSCYHKCPQRCPPIYSPVCGRPGTTVLEPSLVFYNHCFMDAAQCKVKWEDKSESADRAGYIETSFVFCSGLLLSNFMRFIPLIRTLQHMGRLKEKPNSFKHQLRNLRFYNSLLNEDLRFIG